jgi:hypothetical protein
MQEWNYGPDRLYPADSYTTVKIDGAVKLHLSDSDNVPFYESKPESVYTSFKRTVERIPNNIALGKYRRTIYPKLKHRIILKINCS